MGLPPDMQQAVAVSDAKNRPEHPWSYTWANPDDEAKMKSALEDMARERAGPESASAAARAQANGRARKKAKAAPPPPPPPAPLGRAVSRLRAGLRLRGHPGADGAHRRPARRSRSSSP